MPATAFLVNISQLKNELSYLFLELPAGRVNLLDDVDAIGDEECIEGGTG